jgi:thiol-disulfide isomerase/thioredoxin
MNLQEQISRIQSMMNLLVEDEQPEGKVKNISGYDLSKVTIPKMEIGQYPISFYFNNGKTKFKATAILDGGFVYHSFRSQLGDTQIYKHNQSDFEESLKNNTETPSQIETIMGPISYREKPSKKYEKLDSAIKDASKKIKTASQVDVTNIPKIDLTTTMQGKSYVLDFWASFCGPCISKIKTLLNPLNQELSSSGLTFFYYSVDSDTQQLKEYVDSNLSYGVHAFDPTGFESEALKTYGLDGIPRTFFVDKNGNMYKLPSKLQEAKDLITKYL